jgi:hypothetical protein
MAWKIEVFADGAWVGNQLRFATEAEAKGYLSYLRWRSTGVRDTRVVECSDPVNCTYNNGATKRRVVGDYFTKLFAIGLGGLGLLGWRRRRRALTIQRRLTDLCERLDYPPPIIERAAREGAPEQKNGGRSAPDLQFLHRTTLGSGVPGAGPWPALPGLTGPRRALDRSEHTIPPGNSRPFLLGRASALRATGETVEQLMDQLRAERARNAE